MLFRSIYANGDEHEQNTATGLLMFLAKYYKKAKQIDSPKFVLNSVNKEISVFIRGTYCGYICFRPEFALENFVIGSPYIVRRRITRRTVSREEKTINLTTNTGVSRAVKLATEYLKPLDAKMIHTNCRSIANRIIDSSSINSYSYIYETAVVLDNRETRKKLYGSIVGDIENDSLSDKENTLWLLYALCKCGNSSWDSDSFMSAEELSELAKNAVNDLGKFTDRMDALLKERQKHSFIKTNTYAQSIVYVTPENSVYILNSQTMAFYGDIALAPEWITRVTAVLDTVDGSYVESVGMRLTTFPFKEFVGGCFAEIGTYYVVCPEQMC